MSTLSVTQPRQRRRRHSPEFKAQVLAACERPGASVSRIALDHGLNANMVRRWISEARRVGKDVSPAFVPVSLPEAVGNTAKPADQLSTIRIEIPCTRGAVVVEWPADQAQQCIALLRELLP